MSALGHCHPVWVEAVRRQAGELIHVSNLFRHPNQGELARRLVQHAGPGRVFFCNSGAEANEGLIKLARLHGIRKSGEEGKCIKIICAKNAFHGRTFGGMSATPQEKIQKGFRPLVPGFAFGELNNLQSFADLIDDEHRGDFRRDRSRARAASHPCTDEFLWGLRQLCDQHNLLLMLDEVQCGVGRTGHVLCVSALPACAPTPSAWRRVSAAVIRSARSGRRKSTPSSSRPARTARPSAARRSPARRRSRCSTSSSATICSQKVQTQRCRLERAQLEKLVAEFPKQLKAVTGRGYMLGLRSAVANRRPIVAALREDGLLVVGGGRQHGPPASAVDRHAGAPRPRATARYPDTCLVQRMESTSHEAFPQGNRFHSGRIAAAF